MTQTNTAARGTLSTRSGASRKLLSRKAAALATATTGANALEDAFPAAEQYGPPAPVLVLADLPASDAAPATIAEPAKGEPAADQDNPPPTDVTEPVSAPSGQLEPEQNPARATAPAWSSEDEAALQTLLARRKAAGFQRRGRDVGGQVLRVGDIAPNDGTVVAAIVALVAERGTVTRSALLDAMAGATFPHAKAKPQDRGWSNGYIAGAVRDGFLALACEPVDAAEVAR